jgi:hypothetical protein
MGTQLIEIKGEIEENWMFNGQLRVKLHKSKTKEQNEKGTEIRGWNWSLLGAKLNKIESMKLTQPKSWYLPPSVGVLK